MPFIRVCVSPSSGPQAPPNNPIQIMAFSHSAEAGVTGVLGIGLSGRAGTPSGEVAAAPASSSGPVSVRDCMGGGDSVGGVHVGCAAASAATVPGTTGDAASVVEGPSVSVWSVGAVVDGDRTFSAAEASGATVVPGGVVASGSWQHRVPECIVPIADMYV